jgi:hypothetical protein
MKRGALVFLSVCVVLAGGAGMALLDATGHSLFFWKPRPVVSRWLPLGRSFQRVGTFANYRNNASVADSTVSEIVAATADGNTLVYTDGPMAAVGLIDITNPSSPTGTGKVTFPTGHEPTSVDILGNRYALVAVNSRTSFTNTSGYLAVVDLGTRSVVTQIDLGGQPDSLKISPDRRYAAVVIENERDEALCVGGTQGGLTVSSSVCAAGGGALGRLPQTPYGNPAGYLVVIDLVTANPLSWTRRDVALTGLAAYGSEDPEPEFVDINARNQAVVTLQENNHIVIVDLPSASVVANFPAGTVDLAGIDKTEEGLISLTESLSGVAREPDAVTWVPLPLGRFQIATANEGDLFGGSRGFSLFRPDGSLAFDSGSSLEAIAVQHGHYPEDRSANKGTEPEAIEFGRFGFNDYLFVGSERGSFVAVYDMDRGRPRFQQLLPAPFGPEGLLAIPGRNLLVASGEEDVPSFGVRSTVMIYQLRPGAPDYPQILSAEDEDGAPIAWSALSGLTAIPGERNSILGIWDSYYSQSRIFRIDVSEKPAVITDATTITGGTGGYDPEGITIAPDRTMWIASEGNAADSVRNRLLQVNADGVVLREVGLPDQIIACRAATTKRGTLGSGFEGVAAVRTTATTYKLLIAQQRGWDYTTPDCEDLDDDGGGLNASLEPNWSRVWVFDPDPNAAQPWSWFQWELAAKPANSLWVGLSEITETPSGELIFIERDNRTGDFGVLKTLVKVAAQAGADGVVSAAEKAVFDLRPRLTANRGWITDKPEGVAVTGEGRLFVVTDNDGVEDWSGETWFLDLGWFGRLFR